MSDIRTISKMCIDAIHESESDEEEEQELKIILTTERRLASDRSQDSLNSRKSEKLHFENEFIPIKQPFETLLE